MKEARSKKIIRIIRTIIGLGDAISLEPLVSIVKEKNPEAKIALQLLDWIAPIYENHPAIDILVDQNGNLPLGNTILNITALDECPCSRYEVSTMPNVLKSRYQLHCEAAGYQYDGRAPKLYLTDDEIKESEELRRIFPGRKVGIHLRPTEKYREYPHTQKLIEYLLYKTDWQIFLIDNEHIPEMPRTIKLEDLPLRRLMVYLSAMDLVIGPDSGIILLAGALGVPIYGIFGPTDPKMRIAQFGETKWNKEYTRCKRSRCWYEPCKKVWCLRTLSPQKVYKDIKGFKPGLHSVPTLVIKHQKPIALLRLDGLGGTITLSDQAKKLKEKYDRPITLIIRGYKELFNKNPYVDNIITVGAAHWDEVLERYKREFSDLVDIRFAIARWYGKSYKQDFQQWQNLYDNFLIGQSEMRQLERFGLHHIQVTDKMLNLPYDIIESKIYYEPKLSSDLKKILPERYIVINSGVDAIHQGRLQTKCWPYWNDFVRLAELPIVQVGTEYDTQVIDAIDLRGKTTIEGLITVLSQSKAIVTIEGGIMHLAYAMRHPNTIVLRGPTTGKLFEYPGQTMIDSYACSGYWSSTPDWHWKCPKGMITPACMASITPERVAHILLTIAD